MAPADMNGALSLTVWRMTVDVRTDVPPVNETLTRVVVLMRLLGWAWLIALVVTTMFDVKEANKAVLAGAAVIA
ncbi:MAG: hypothetical protein O6650_02250, partial [Actinobacteria bacterium]|nr:hypothetical protein [Actinomycetota bacterium]